MDFTNSEIQFLLESLEWSKTNFEERSRKYFNLEGYEETTYKPKIKEFNMMREKLLKEKKGRR